MVELRMVLYSTRTLCTSSYGNQLLMPCRPWRQTSCPSAVKTQCLPLAVVRSWLQLQFVNVQCWSFDEVFYIGLCCLRSNLCWAQNRSFFAIYNARNARIANAVLATAIPSVHPSVCPSVTGLSLICLSAEYQNYTLNHKKRDFLFLTITVLHKCFTALGHDVCLHGLHGINSWLP